MALTTARLHDYVNHYHYNKGFFRKTFDALFVWTGLDWGMAKGMQEISAFADQLPNKNSDSVLNEAELEALSEILSDRWQRVRVRDNHYFTDKGHQKLTNNILRHIANVIEGSMPESEALHPYVLSPTVQYQKLENGQHLAETPIANLALIEEQGRDYLIDLSTYGQGMSANDEFVTPYQHSPLSQGSLEQLYNHTIFGKIFKKLSEWIQNLKEVLVGESRTQPAQNFISINGQMVVLSDWLDNCTYTQFTQQKVVIGEKLSFVLPADSALHNKFKELLFHCGYWSQNEHLYDGWTTEMRNAPPLYLSCFNGQVHDVRVWLKSCTMSDFRTFVFYSKPEIRALWSEEYQQLFQQVYQRYFMLKSEGCSKALVESKPLMSLVINSSGDQVIDAFDSLQYCQLEQLNNYLTDIRSHLLQSCSQEKLDQVNAYLNKVKLTENFSNMQNLQLGAVMIIGNQLVSIDEEINPKISELPKYLETMTIALKENPCHETSLNDYLGVITECIAEWEQIAACDGFQSIENDRYREVEVFGNKVIHVHRYLSNFEANNVNNGYEGVSTPLNHQELSSLQQFLLNDSDDEYLSVQAPFMVAFESMEAHRSRFLPLLGQLTQKIEANNSSSSSLFDMDTKISNDFAVTLSDCLVQDARVVLRSLTLNTGLKNPATQQALTAADVQTLSAHAEIGAMFQHCQQMMQEYQAGKVSNHTKQVFGLEHRLMDLLITSTGEINDIYMVDDVFHYALKNYLADEISKQEFIDVIELMHSNIKSDIQLKQSLSEEREAVLEEEQNPVYLKLKQAVVMQSTFGIEGVSKQDFWSLLQKVFDEVLEGKSSNLLRDARSACNAIKAFDERGPDFIRRAGAKGQIGVALGSYGQPDYSSEYVVRRDESFGQEKGEAALRNVVNTFKGTFLSALRHNFCREFFDRYDKGGICIGEKTRNARTWALSLDDKKVGQVQKTMLELLASYQDELTGSSQSKYSFYEGLRAVDFILQRHNNESFTYENSHGDMVVGTINRNIITYYLSVYMADDKLIPPNPAPECFQALKQRALKM